MMHLPVQSSGSDETKQFPPFPYFFFAECKNSAFVYLRYCSRQLR